MEREEFLQKLRTLGHATFDMDGTIIKPGLLVFDVMSNLFQGKNDTRKMGELKKIYESYGSVPFDVSYRSFLGLLKGEDRKEVRNAVMDRLEEKVYPYARLTIKKLREGYRIRCYLISLTTDFIAELVKPYFGFEGAYSVGCIVDDADGREIFTGEASIKLGSAGEMKTAMFGKFEKDLAGSPFLSAFDSKDDLPIAQKAFLKVGVNQSKELKNMIKADVSLEGKDPWEEFYRML